MSFAYMSEVFKTQIGNASCKFVLMKLADQANDDGECWPSYQSIAEACEITKRSVINHIKWLVENGFVKIKKRRLENGKNKSNVYRITLGKVIPKEIKNSDENSSGIVKSVQHDGEIRSTSHGEQISPESINIEPINEPIKGGERASEQTVDEIIDSSLAAIAAPPSPEKPAKNKSSSPAKPKQRSENQQSKKQKPKFNALQALKDHGVDEQVAEDYLASRKTKLTKTALDGLLREADKAGLPLAEVIQICVERGWMGFKANWESWKEQPKAQPNSYQQHPNAPIRPSFDFSGTETPYDGKDPWDLTDEEWEKRYDKRGEKK